MKFSVKDFFSKCDQIHGKLRIWSHLLKKSLMEIFIFCAVTKNKFSLKDFFCVCDHIWKLLVFVKEILKAKPQFCQSGDNNHDPKPIYLLTKKNFTN